MKNKILIIISALLLLTTVCITVSFWICEKKEVIDNEELAVNIAEAILNDKYPDLKEIIGYGDLKLQATEKNDSWLVELDYFYYFEQDYKKYGSEMIDDTYLEVLLNKNGRIESVRTFGFYKDDGENIIK